MSPVYIGRAGEPEHTHALSRLPLLPLLIVLQTEEKASTPTRRHLGRALKNLEKYPPPRRMKANGTNCASALLFSLSTRLDDQQLRNYIVKKKKKKKLALSLCIEKYLLKEKFGFRENQLWFIFFFFFEEYFWGDY